MAKAKKAKKSPNKSKGSSTAAIGGINAPYLPKGVVILARGPVGKTSGVGLQAFRCKMLFDNEKASKEKKLTDDQIAAACRKEFPTLTGEHMEAFWVNSFRSKYNQGTFTGGVKPATPSHRYDEKGRPCPQLPRAFWTMTTEGKRNYADFVDAMNRRMEAKAKKAAARTKATGKKPAKKKATAKKATKTKPTALGKAQRFEDRFKPKKKAKKRPTAKRAKKKAAPVPSIADQDRAAVEPTFGG